MATYIVKSGVLIPVGVSATEKIDALDLIPKTTTFNADGSISCVADSYESEVTFNDDGSITEEYLINGVTITKTTEFNGDTITETIE